MTRGAALCVLGFVTLVTLTTPIGAQPGNAGADNGRPQLVNDGGRPQVVGNNAMNQQQRDQGQQQERLRRLEEVQRDNPKVQARRERAKQQGEMLSRMYSQSNQVEGNEDNVAKRFLTKEQYELDKQQRVDQQQNGGGADPNLLKVGGQGQAGQNQGQDSQGFNPRDYSAMGRRQKRDAGLPGEIDPAGLGNIPDDVRQRILKMNEERRAQLKLEEQRQKGMPDGPNLGVRDGVSGMEQQQAWPGAQHEKAHPYATRYKGEAPPKEMHEYVKTDMVTFKLDGGATETFYEFSSPDTEQFDISYVLRGPEHSQLDIVVYAPNGKEVSRGRGKKYHQMKVKIDFQGAYRVDITNLYGDEVVVSFGLETNDNIGKELQAVNQRERELAIDENLEPIAEVLERVDARVADIRKEQRYMLIRERDHQLTQDNTHYRVMIYSVLESLVFVGAAVFQNLWVINLVKTSKPLGGV